MLDVLAETQIVGNLGAVGYGLAAIGPGIGVGIVFAAYIQASARQPESAAANRTWLIMGFAVVEALALFGLVLAFALSSKP
jgi:F-type H+-transporting ATPase subunit c